MKKVVAIGLCIAMCVMMILCVVPAAVSANTSVTVSGTYQNGVLSISWTETLPEGYALTKVTVGSVTKSGSYTGNKADISVNLRPGKYDDAECVFTGPGESITSKFSLVIPTGSVGIKTFEIEQYPSGSRKGRIKIRDEFGEIPVGLKVTISGVEGSLIEIEKGNYTSFDLPEDMDSVKLEAEPQTVNYEGYSILFEQASSNTLKVQLSPEEQLGFQFKEDHRSFNADTGTLQVTWNAASANGTDIVAIVVNGKTYDVVSDYSGGFTADLSALAPGHYDMSYVFLKTSGTKVTLSVDSLERGGELATELSVKVENGKITATLTDKSLKRPVANADVKLRIGQTDFPAQKTDKNGKVVFNNAPPTDVSTVLCIFTGMTDGAILYSGCTGSMTGIVTIPPTPTTTGSSSSTTRPPTTNTPTKRPDTSTPDSDSTATSGTVETPPSYAVIAGAGTTSVLNDKIGVNVTYDQGILEQFGMSEAEFNSRALLLIPKDFYSSLSGSNSTVMLSARYSPIKVTSQQISSAVSNISKFSKYDAANVQTVTMDMGLLIGDTQTAIPFSSDEYQLQVRLPVPSGMKDCDVLAVAYTNETSLGTPTEVKVKDGYLEFAVQQLGTFTVLGFSKDSGNGGGGIPTMILVLLIVGVLMLIGAGLLIYFFVIRKPKDDDDDLPPDDGSDLGGPNGGEPDAPMPIVPDGYEPILPIPEAEGGAAGSIPVDPRTDTVPLNRQSAAAESRDIFSSDSRDIYSSDTRDIYSSASRQPAPAPRARAEDVTLGAYRASKGAEHAAPKKRTKKDPSDYDIKL